MINYANGGLSKLVRYTYDPEKSVLYGAWSMVVQAQQSDRRKTGSFGDRETNNHRPVNYYETSRKRKRRVGECEDYAMELSTINDSRSMQASGGGNLAAKSIHQDYAARNSLVKYNCYRYQSGRDAFIEKHWWATTPKKLEFGTG